MSLGVEFWKLKKGFRMEETTEPMVQKCEIWENISTDDFVEHKF